MHHDFKDHEKVVERLNDLQKDWVAAVPETFKDFDIKTMNRHAGRRKYGHRASAATSSGAAHGFSFAQTSNNGKADDDAKKWERYSREDLGDLP